MRMTMQARTQSKTVAEGFQEFIAVKVNESVAKATINSYANIIAIFMSFMGKILCVQISRLTQCRTIYLI